MRTILAALNPRFHLFVTPMVVTHIYRLIRIMGALQASLFIAVLIAVREWIGPVLLIFGIAAVPVVWLVGCLLARIILEFFVIAFSIYAELRELNRNTREEDRWNGESLSSPWEL